MIGPAEVRRYRLLSPATIVFAAGTRIAKLFASARVFGDEQQMLSGKISI